MNGKFTYILRHFEFTKGVIEPKVTMLGAYVADTPHKAKVIASRETGHPLSSLSAIREETWSKR